MKHRLEGLLQHALNRAKEGGALKLESLPPLFFEVPKDSAFGDLASTVALGLARAERKAPRAIAEAIVAHIEDPDGLLAGVEIAGPGYLNFRFSPRFWAADACARSSGRTSAVPTLGDGQRVLVEFVSANPTGPLHVGHGRGAVLGDAVARLLERGRLRRDARVLRQRRRQADRDPRRARRTRACCRRTARRADCPRTATRASTCAS